jgi:cytochrome c oxidase accessory protein FixG
MTHAPTGSPQPSPERVLSTLNADGTRRWLRPRLSPGRFLNARFVVGWALIVIFVLIPHLRVANKPVILLDVVHRQFTLFGKTFLATDLIFLTFFLVGVIVAVFLVTAILGRVWCGWACPQTVYLELLFRPLEQWLEGGPSQQRRLDREGPNARRLLKNVLFLLISGFLAHTFLAYFVGWDDLVAWVQRNPIEHPLAFLLVAGTTGAMFFDFAWFREQTCVVACPYGRLQSVLLDRDSLIVGYDAQRGEPRLKPAERKKAPNLSAGDCIECRACVNTCPTGIDIRDGLQMECIGCAQCIDACDAIMDRVGKPRGLVRYSSENLLAGKPLRLLRPRTIIYPVVLLIAFGVLAVGLASDQSADVTFLRRLGAPYTATPDGTVTGQIRIKIQNRAHEERSYSLELLDYPEAELIAPENPLRVPAGKSATTSLFVLAPLSSFDDGERPIAIRIDDGVDFEGSFEYLMLGPRERSP